MVPKSHLPERKVKQGVEGHQCQGPEDYEHLQRCPGGAVAREAVLYVRLMNWNPMPVLLKSVPYKEKV